MWENYDVNVDEDKNESQDVGKRPVKPAKRRLSEPQLIFTINPNLDVDRTCSSESYKGEEYPCSGSHVWFNEMACGAAQLPTQLRLSHTSRSNYFDFPQRCIATFTKILNSCLDRFTTICRSGSMFTSCFFHTRSSNIIARCLTRVIAILQRGL